jgi:nitroimidazol reductase NimA-like FMN-containing flavoprotein (pyridoxamine 5'-phosphate oxidase superfamily)
MSDEAASSIPRADRPHIPEYGIPEHSEGLLPWEHVVERIKASRNYWIATTRPDGQPHARPVWGVWVDDALYFGGGAHTRWARNLAQNPAVVVHLEDGHEAVIIEGTVEVISDPAHPLVARLDAAYEAKYDTPHGVPVWRLHPRVAFAWTRFPDDTTRWVFGSA